MNYPAIKNKSMFLLFIVSLLAGAYADLFHALSIPMFRATFVLSADDSGMCRKMSAFNMRRP